MTNRVAGDRPVSSWERTYITMHVVWHPCCDESAAAARQLIEHVLRDPLHADDMGVSVFEWSPPPAGSSVPSSVRLGTSEADVVVLLIGNEIQQDSQWSTYVTDLARRCRSDADHSFTGRLIPVAVSSNDLSKSFGVQALRWDTWPEDQGARARRLVREVTYATSRMLRAMLIGGEPPIDVQAEKVRVFLSHSKHDSIGERIAKRVRKWVQEDVQLSVFLDVADIPAGLPSNRVLEHEVRQSAVLIVYSDSFSSREWCQREVLIAKESHRPIVVADCIEALDERAFPYIANVPVVRLRSRQPHGIERVIGRLLDEVFIDFLWKCRVAALRQANPDVMFVARKPELLTLVNSKKELSRMSAIVYPDPPLGSRERSLLDGFGPEIQSLSEWMREEPL